MSEMNTFFQYISVRRRIMITISLLVLLIVTIGLYSLMAIVESNHRLHESILAGQNMSQMIDTARLAQVHFKKQVQEWKDILLRGNDPILFEKHWKAFKAEEQLVNEYLNSLEKMTDTMDTIPLQIRELLALHEQLGGKYEQALMAYNHSDLRSAVVVDKMVRGIDREPTNRMDAMLKTTRQLAEKRLKETETLAATTLHAYQSLAVFLTILVFMCVCFGIFMAMSILNDLDREVQKGDRENDD
jgi:methyl-accepting chemotaxis protein